MRNAAPVLGMICALLAAALSLGTGTVGIVLTLLNRTTDTLALATMSVSIIGLGFGLGLAVALSARHAQQGIRSRPFEPRHVWILAALFALVLAAGQLVLTLDLLPLLAFPILHILASVLPPIFIVALVGRGLGAVTTRRDVTIQYASGALVATPIAIALESLVLLVLGTAALAAIVVHPGGFHQVQALLDQAGSPEWLQDPSNLIQYLRSPVIVAALLFLVALVIPLIEESVKAIGVGLRSYCRPGLAESFLWGVACGAGFATVEGLFSSIGGLDAWAPMVLLRSGATLLHCLTGGLMGMAWYFLLVRRTASRALALFAVSVMVHGLWNALSIGIALSSMHAADDPSNRPSAMLAPGATIAVAGLLILACSAVLALWALVRYTRSYDSIQQPADDATSDIAASASIAGSTADELS